MNFGKNESSLLGGIIVLFYILPFVIFTQYTHLGPDDLCRTNSSFQTFFQGIISWYSDHNGRYINSFFSLMPVYDLQIYRSILTASMVIFFCVVVFFIRSLLILTGRDSKKEAFLFSLLFIVLLMSELPSLYEMFYWYASTTVYLYSSIFVLLLLLSLLESTRGNNKATVASGFLVILVTGNTEMYIPLVGLILAVWFFWFMVAARKIQWNLFFLIIIWLISALGVFMAPGSEKRQSMFSESGQFFFSLMKSFETALKILWNRLHEPTFWMFLLVIFIISVGSKNTKAKRRAFNPMIVLLLSALAFISTIFVPFFALGFLDYSAGRIINCIHFVFYIIVIINLLNLINILSCKFHSSLSAILFVTESSILRSLVFIIFLVTVSVSSQNFKGMHEDLVTKSYIKFDEEMTIRYELLKSTKKDTIELGRLMQPKILDFKEDAIQPECLLQHVKLHYNPEISTIIIKN